ncbi:MAG TPA: KpsF/GutQ family sugar-phosphate isomerase [Gammaproteobacteria bacterium]|nr:KpsF/GutQ family sugar-phosphate isomerase [Gammaproteobacteria bacterium]HRA42195.1 KpsF/GutQ family sugar-phosphate isomerase [Gammaproteobacteria bacterium]
MSANKLKIIATGLSVLEIEAKAITELRDKINAEFVESCLALLNCEGRVVVMGIGKSGHIGRKIAATLSSTGSPAFFLHPAEASHGDLGMITSKDLVIALSYSGEAAEILTILPSIKRLDVKIIALTGAPHSTLAKIADISLDIGVRQEACPLGLAPTASTTAMLAMGDAIALAVLEARGFTADDFAKSHPGGKLGRRLLLKIEEIMHTGNDIPRVQEGAMLIDALPEMSRKRLGFTTIVNAKDADRIIGIFTDGDLRRALNRGLNVHETRINEVMTQKFTTVSNNLLASEAIAIMEKLKTLVMPVINEQGKLVGAFNMHDLFKAGVM